MEYEELQAIGAFESEEDGGLGLDYSLWDSFREWLDEQHLEAAHMEALDDNDDWGN